MSNNFILEKMKSEGALLAIIPFLGSLAAFAFEIGYLTYYDVPYDVINIGFYRILTSTLWLSLALAVLWVCFARAIAIATSPNKSIKNAFLVILLMGLIAFVAMTIEFNRVTVASLLGWLLSQAVVLFAWLVSSQGPLGKKLPEPLTQAVKDGEAIAERSHIISSIYIGPFVLIGIMLALVGCLGYWQAKMTIVSWVLDDKPEFILVRKYEDSYIFKEYNQTTMKISDRVKILNVEQEKNITLRRTFLRGLTSNFGETHSN